DDGLVAGFDEDFEQLLHVGRHAVDGGEVALQTAERLDENEAGDGLQMGIRAYELHADAHERTEQRAAVHGLHEVLEGGVARVIGGWIGGRSGAVDELLYLLERKVAVEEVSAVVVNGVELEDEAERRGHGGLETGRERGMIGVRRSGGSGAGARMTAHPARVGFGVHAFVEDERLRVELILERLVVSWLTHV